MTTGARMSVPLGATPCGSSVPTGCKTVRIFAGTHSRNLFQVRRSISRVLGAFRLVTFPGDVSRRGNVPLVFFRRVASNQLARRMRRFARKDYRLHCMEPRSSSEERRVG